LVNESIDAVAYEWIFQGDTFNIENPKILPAQNGTHEIILTVSNNDGCTHTSSQFVEILESPIAEAVSINPLGCAQLGAFFENNSQFSDTYLWDFGNGNTSTDFEPEQVYPDTGTYSVVLISSNMNNCPESRDSLEITVWPNPVADFDFIKEDECISPTLVFFENNSIDNLDNDWNFGDGSAIENFIDPEHTFNDPGEYQVQLIVENIFGCLDTLEKTVNIYAQPEASYDLSDTVGCEDFSVQFNNTSINSISYQWIIDSFPIITEASPEVVFQTPGVYGVQLIAAYSDNCQDTTTFDPVAITVYESPLASFDYEADLDENIIGDVQFNNLSLRADRYLWDLGDGNSTTVTSPFHEYDINRSIDVLLTAYNDNGGAYVCSNDTLIAIAPEWISTFYAPNVLSPESGEDAVRVFRPVGIGLETYEINVYSSWGNLVWNSTSLQDNRPDGEWCLRQK